MERTEVKDLSVEMQFESCAVECIGLELIIVCIYRPPSGDISLFFSKLDEILSLQAIKNYNVIIVGDINIDLLDKCNNTYTMPNKYIVSIWV